MRRWLLRRDVCFEGLGYIAGSGINQGTIFVLFTVPYIVSCLHRELGFHSLPVPPASCSSATEVNA